MTPTTVSEAFIKWMQDNGFGSFEPEDGDGTIFLNQVPNEAIDSAYWVITSGGPEPELLVTRESIQEFSTQVFYRNKSGEVVEHNLFALNQRVNGRDTLEIEGFELYSIRASQPEDEGKDAERRPQGSLTVAIQIYVS